MIFMEKSKVSLGGALIKLQCDSNGIRIGIFLNNNIVAHMTFPDTASGLSYAKRCYNGLQ